MEEWLKYWERNETRRPFPSMYIAESLYGKQVWFPKPEYVEKRHCKWCNKELSGRRTSFCCDEHSKSYSDKTVWNRNRDAYSLRILYRDNFTCQDCGEFHAFINEFDVALPVDDGKLNVHHIQYVSNGGGDEPENLITLCTACHVKRHSNDHIKKEGEINHEKI